MNATVVAPTLTKSFAPNPITSGGTSTLTLLIDNSANATTALSAVALTDTYPAAITNAASPSVTNTCNGSVTAAPGGSSVALSGGTIAAGGSCTVTVQVTSTTVGPHDNTAGGVSSAEAPTSAPASATLTVNAAASVHVTTPAGFGDINSPPPGYSTSGGRNSDKHLEVTVTLNEGVDGTGPPVAGATVSATIYLDPDVAVGGGTGTTDTSGQVTFRITNAPSGHYSTTVTDVTAAGFTWDQNTPENGFDK